MYQFEKNGTRINMSNSHLFNLTSAVGELYESIMKNDSLDHLDEHNFITGFPKGIMMSILYFTNTMSIYKKVKVAARRDDNSD